MIIPSSRFTSCQPPVLGATQSTQAFMLLSLIGNEKREVDGRFLVVTSRASIPLYKGISEDFWSM